VSDPKAKNNDTLDTEKEIREQVTINYDTVEKILQKIQSKNVDRDTVKTVFNTVTSFVKKHHDVEVNPADPSNMEKVIRLALEYDNPNVPKDSPLKDLIETNRKHSLYRKDVSAYNINNNVKPIGLDFEKVTNLIFVVDPNRTAIEFNDNLDRNVYKMIESLNDPRFHMSVVDVDKTVTDDNSNRVNV